MTKRFFASTCFILLLAGCTNEESMAPVKQETKEEVKETSVEPLEATKEEKPVEQIIKVDLVPLKEKIWSTTEEDTFLHFTHINETTLEFQLLVSEGYRMQEHTIVVNVSTVTANSAEGTITKAITDNGTSLLGLEKNKVRLVRINDSFELSIENLLDSELLETSLDLNDWTIAKNTVKELTESEALNLIYQSEKIATEAFSDAFTENNDGYSFNQSFENIISPLKSYYTKEYQSDSLRSIYEDPIIMLEYLYAFPLTEIPKENFLVNATAEKIEIYYEADMYGASALYYYTLVVEDGLWKVHSRANLLSPGEAAYAAKVMSDYGEYEETLSRTIESDEFYDYIETILTGSRYHVELYEEYDGIPQTISLYQVDPFTRMVYHYDRVLDEATELGIAFE